MFPLFKELILSQVDDAHRILRLHAKYDKNINIKCISLQYFQSGSFMKTAKKLEKGKEKVVFNTIYLDHYGNPT